MTGWWIVELLAIVACDAGSGRPASMGELPAGVVESSGLVASRTHAGVFWTHNDSGGTARLYAVSATGRSLGEVAVDGAAAVDWEAVTTDGAGHLWIGDIGNNANDRRDLTVYRVPEPRPGVDAAVSVDRRVRFTFPDQVAFPDPARRDFDAEALFWTDDTLWLASKHRSDLATTLYRFPATEGEVVLERIADLDLGGDPDRFGGRATDAALHPSGRFLAVLSYHALFVFERPDDGRSWWSKPVNRVALDQGVAGQCEGVAWDGWSVVFTNEGRAMFRVDDPFRGATFPERR